MREKDLLGKDSIDKSDTSFSGHRGRAAVKSFSTELKNGLVLMRAEDISICDS